MKTPPRSFRSAPGLPAVELTPPETLGSVTRRCNVCAEREADREVRFGNCAVVLAFCKPCAGMAASALTAPMKEV